MPCVLLRPSGEPRSFPITTLSPLPPVSTLSLPPAHFLFVPFILFMFPTLSFFNPSGKQGSVTPLPSHGSIPSSSLSIFLYYHRGQPPIPSRSFFGTPCQAVYTQLSANPSTWAASCGWRRTQSKGPWSPLRLIADLQLLPECPPTLCTSFPFAP